MRRPWSMARRVRKSRLTTTSTDGNFGAVLAVSRVACRLRSIRRNPIRRRMRRRFRSSPRFAVFSASYIVPQWYQSLCERDAIAESAHDHLADRSAYIARRTTRSNSTPIISVTPALTLTSQTGYNKDFLYSTEDFNRFNTRAGFLPRSGQDITEPLSDRTTNICDPQLGCSSRSLAQDVLATKRARQFYQEVRLASNFNGPFNFVAGGNYLSYHTLEDYYVFSNALTLIATRRPSTDYFGGAPAAGTMRRIFRSMRRSPIPAIRSLPITDRTCCDRHFLGARLRLYRSQSAQQRRRAGPQLFPQPQSLQAEILGRVRRGLLSDHARCEADRRLALHRRQEDLRGLSRAGR